jgi:hypothetical protein
VAVTNGDHHHHLETITEKDSSTKDLSEGGKVKGADSTVPKSVQNSVDSSLMEKSRRHLKERYSTSVDPSQLDKLLHVNGEEPERSRDDSDLSRVSVSVRKEISTKFGMDVDGLMKTIENMHRPIEDVNVVSPSKRQQPQETVAAMVTATDTDKRPGRTALEFHNNFVIQCALWFIGCH